MLGLCLLQELNSFSDQQALDAFGFDIRWQYALDAADQEAYLSRRSLVEFRRRLAAQDPHMSIVRAVFEKISKSAISKLGLSAGEQRVDSTHIVSNICTRGRMDLFHKTIDHFIKSPDKTQFMRVPRHIQKWYQREAQGWFKFDDTGRVVQCPKGHSPIDHRMLSANNQKGRSLHAIFNGAFCRKCTKPNRCPVHAPNHRGRGCDIKDTVGYFRCEITPQLRLRYQMYAVQQTDEKYYAVWSM